MILLPGLVLALWGLVNMQRETASADAEVRMQLQGAAELLTSRLSGILVGAPDGWTPELMSVRIEQGVLSSPLLFPEIPEPQPENEAQRLFSAGEFSRVYGEHRGALSASGLPLAALAAEGMVRISTTPEQKQHWAGICAAEALNHHPSAVSGVVLGNAENHLRAAGLRPAETIDSWQSQWQERLTLRELLGRRAADLVLLRRIAVLDAPLGPWLVLPRDGALRIWPVDGLQRVLGTAAGGLHGEVPSWLGFRVSTTDGYNIFPGTGDETAASAHGTAAVVTDGLRVEAIVGSPATLLQHRRRRMMIQGAMLTAAVAAACYAWWHARRAWHRQADLAAQKDNFLASVSHELRTPLASVRTLTENLAAGTVTEPAAREHYYEVMLQEIQRLSGLVENVLDFARISQDRKHYTFAPCDVAALIAGALRPMHPLAARRGVSLVEDLEPLPQPPLADSAAVQQALINLVDNALKFAPPGSAVRVLVRSTGDAWELAVEDDGPGIPAGEEERIFERFYRAGAEMRRETPGAGIGLSLVRHTAHGHGGEVFALTRAEGGAHVGMRLKLTPAPDPNISL